MRVLAIADTEERWLTAADARDRLREYDLIVSCGDLDARYLEHIVTMANVPLLYVWGNHDTAYRLHTPEGCHSIEGRIAEYRGVRFMGLGGSVRYNDRVFGFTERDMYWRMVRLSLAAKAQSGVDVLVTHTPPRGYGDLNDLPHQGFDAFNTCLEMLSPRYLLHGHIHPEYGRIAREYTHPAGTEILNCCGYRELDLSEPAEPRSVRRGYLGVDRI